MKIILQYKIIFIGLLIGAIGGYAYYYFVGCTTGGCPITSNPLISTFYGATMGGLVFSNFNTRRKV